MSGSIQIKNLEIKVNQDGLFCLNDLHKASGGENKNKPNLWLENSKTNELIEEISKAGIPAIKKSAGRYGGTYVCKELVYAYAMWISPKFHLEVIRVFDAQSKVVTELDSLVNNVKAIGESLSKQINKTTSSIQEINKHGAAWSAYGHQIRKAKREATKTLEALKDEIQLKLDLM